MRILSIYIFAVVITVQASMLHSVLAQQLESEEPITTQEQCVAELVRVRTLMAQYRVSWDGESFGPLDLASSHQQGEAEARSYRDELLNALSAMNPSTPRFTPEQIEIQKNQPIQPVTQEMVSAMMARGANTEDAPQVEEVVRTAPPFTDPTALQAWQSRAERMEELRALRKSLESATPEERIAALQAWDQQNKAADMADREVIDAGLQNIQEASQSPVSSE